MSNEAAGVRECQLSCLRFMGVVDLCGSHLIPAIPVNSKVPSWNFQPVERAQRAPIETAIALCALSVVAWCCTHTTWGNSALHQTFQQHERSFVCLSWWAGVS